MRRWGLPFLGGGNKNRKKLNGGKGNQANSGVYEEGSGIRLSSDISANVQQIKNALGNSSDIVVREIREESSGFVGAAFVYIEEIVDATAVNQLILHPMMMDLGRGKHTDSTSEWLSRLKNRILSVGQVSEIGMLDEALARLLEGCTLAILQGSPIVLAAGTSGGEKRAIDEPSSQTVIRGPKEGFTESIKTNISLMRRRIKTPNLRVEIRQIGKQTKTGVGLLYIKGIAKDEVVEEIRSRLSRIDTDSILESAYIEEFIQDATYTPFPTIFNTERPDAAVAGILEGQVAIVVDGTPFVLLAPVAFVRFFQSSEDFYQRYDIATFLRVIRYIAFFVSMLLPALFIAVSTYHQEMLPTPLLISLAAQREGVPFPAIVEALLMELTFEVLREAGIRMPKVIGPAISIVGALVLGQAAVQAGLISAAMVIVVSFTAIANFVIPAINMSIAVRLIRFVMMLLAGTLGLFGIMSGLMFLLIHMASLRSFGVPYLAPLSPFIWSNWKDFFVRVPQWAINKRPKTLVRDDNLNRQGDNQMPTPPKPKSGG